jgi:predicted enzyme related to lactoylglutathione lyase
MANRVVHFEIGCRDQTKAKEFFGQLFDWKFDAQGPSLMIDTKVPGGITGHFTALGHEPFHYTTFYVQVDDVQAMLDKVNKLGGKTVVPPVTIPPGTFAWFADLDGNTIGLWKPA